ncbi:hypothetical protein [Cellvibrio sp. OA-2007]|uniref:hypothetical protein n=1 Tax=Cellvibrio sp. OA-2007 TaxID=529823 RepID=UPI0007842D8D|nr:hypothetical protein [Cellvibrio sp. OA-2007]
MSNIITCAGNLIPAKAGPTSINNVLACDSGWEIVPYVQPSDSTAIYSQLVALNEFDPVKISGIVIFSLTLFIVGFGVGMVINRLRRS